MPREPLPWATSPIEEISDREFASFQALIRREAGIHLTEVKKALLVGRLSRRLRVLGLTRFSDYHSRLVSGEDPGELVQAINAICTNETHFFREPRHFELLDRDVFPRWRDEGEAGQRPRRVRIWSAACSTGEEPYSLAMILSEHFAGLGWDLEIWASDLSTKVLDAAKRGVWSVQKATEIPQAYLRKYMLRGYGSQEGSMRASSEIRSMIRFAQVNLIADSYAMPKGFDLLFCRNTLIYFDADTKRHVLGSLTRHLSPTGYLFLGHAETVSGHSDKLRAVMPTIYTWNEKSRPDPVAEKPVEESAEKAA